MVARPLQVALIDATVQTAKPIEISAGEIQRIAGQTSSRYQLAMSEEQLDSVVLYQQGNTLALEYEGEFILAIDDFFNPDTNIALALGATLGKAARLTRGGKFSRSYDGGAYVDSHQFSADLWGSNWGANPNSGEALGAVLMTALPAGFLTSQGLT